MPRGVLREVISSEGNQCIRGVIVYGSKVRENLPQGQVGDPVVRL